MDCVSARSVDKDGFGPATVQHINQMAQIIEDASKGTRAMEEQLRQLRGYTESGLQGLQKIMQQILEYFQRDIQRGGDDQKERLTSRGAETSRGVDTREFSVLLKSHFQQNFQQMEALMDQHEQVLSKVLQQQGFAAQASTALLGRSLQEHTAIMQGMQDGMKSMSKNAGQSDQDLSGKIDAQLNQRLQNLRYEEASKMRNVMGAIQSELVQDLDAKDLATLGARTPPLRDLPAQRDELDFAPRGSLVDAEKEGHARGKLQAREMSRSGTPKRVSLQLNKDHHEAAVTPRVFPSRGDVSPAGSPRSVSSRNLSDTKLQDFFANYHQSMVASMREQLQASLTPISSSIDDLRQTAAPGGHVNGSRQGRSLVEGLDAKSLANLAGQDEDNNYALMKKASKDHLGSFAGKAPGNGKKGDGTIGGLSDMWQRPETDLATRRYHVEDHYYKRGCAQALARSECFEHVTLMIVVLNTVYLGLDADMNDAPLLYDSDDFFFISDNAFCLYFTVELIIRFCAFARKCDSIRDAWFAFDLLLVAMMIFETWIMAPFMYFFQTKHVGIPLQPLRVLRLMRLTRLTRLVRTCPELVTMTKGLAQGARACVASVVMVFILIYIFGIGMISLLKNSPNTNAKVKEEVHVDFSNLGHAMWILLVNGTFMMDGTGLLLTDLLLDGTVEGVVACLLLVGFIFLSAQVICNMLIGVLCAVVEDVTRTEKDSQAIKVMKDGLLAHLKQYDDGDGMITKSELAAVMNEPASRIILDRLNVDRVFMLALENVFYDDGDTQVPIARVMELMLSCRGDSTATVHTIASSMSYMTATLGRLENHLLSARSF